MTPGVALRKTRRLQIANYGATSGDGLDDVRFPRSYWIPHSGHIFALFSIISRYGGRRSEGPDTGKHCTNIRKISSILSLMAVRRDSQGFCRRRPQHFQHISRKGRQEHATSVRYSKNTSFSISEQSNCQTARSSSLRYPGDIIDGIEQTFMQKPSGEHNITS